MESTPCLLLELKRALAALSANQSELQAPAHEFLMKIQSRNMRRKIHSLQQARNQTDSRPIATTELLQAVSSSSMPSFLGSSWLACSSLLMDPDSSSEQERLFAAQTLLHRLRRVRLAESVDIEMESSSAEDIVQIIAGNNWLLLFQRCVAGMPINSLNGWIDLMNGSNGEEEVVKGVLAIVTLGCATMSVFSASSSRALMETLLLALTTAAFRLRYTTTLSPQNAPITIPSLVQLLQESLQYINHKPHPDLALMAVATLFDSILGSPHGARGRLSCEPFAMRSAAHELRHDVMPMLETFIKLGSPIVASRACARIAPFAAIPCNCVTHCSADEALWMALYESASQSLESMGVNMTGMDFVNKKKGKKKELYPLPDVHAEQRGRGEVACWATTRAATHTLWMEHPEVLAAAATACLPHCIRYCSSNKLVVTITGAVHRTLCESSNWAVRSLALEPLYALHATIVETPSALQHQEGITEVLVEYFSECSIALAGACAYPHDYFCVPTIPSDYDLEVERNDIRDVVRTVAGSGEGGSTSQSSHGNYPMPIAAAVMSKLLEACSKAPFSEAVAHLFSSLAKPVNHLSKCVARGPRHEIDTTAEKVVRTTLQFLRDGNECVVRMFQKSLPVDELLPISRIMNIANASYSPFLSSVMTIPSCNSSVPGVLDAITRASIVSMERLPELLAPSILSHSVYDIRGSMRGPGGDDHVGCLTLMRLTSEGNDLTAAMTKAMAPYASDLGLVYSRWKQSETERGIGVFHGSGVTPRTRRILLSTLGKAQSLSSMLLDLFMTTVSSIASIDLDSAVLDEYWYYQMAEATFDLSAFSASDLSSLFQSREEVSRRCFEVIGRACIEGYKLFSSSGDIGAIHQWNRLRAAIFVLARDSHPHDLSERAAEILQACLIAECEASLNHLGKQEDSPSQLFQDTVISPDAIPAGLFIHNVSVALERCCSLNAPRSCNSLEILNSNKATVHRLVVFDYGEPYHFKDPRLTTTEAWFGAMTRVALLRIESSICTSLLVDATSVATSLLFTSPIKKLKQDSGFKKCLSLDGPQGLSLMSFFVSLIQRSGTALQAATAKLCDEVPVDCSSVVNTEILGIAILFASFFRAFQGALPPWALEFVPELFSAMHSALGNNTERFGTAVLAAMDMRASASFGSVLHGTLLSGPYFGSLQQGTKHQFVRDIQELCVEGEVTSWRRLKVLVKRVCGGKKKSSDYNQKPALTRWNFTKL